MTRRVIAADLFCGAGGFSSGLLRATEDAGWQISLTAVNHWTVAIATHRHNHPSVRHVCGDLETVDPRKLFPEGKLNLLLASPECTHHSNARGGKPMSDQRRASAWHILRWLDALHVSNVLVENVREFRNWGPLGENGRPLKSKQGSLYRQFLASLEALGYRVEERVLNAADYGDATTRQRLFIQARKGNRKIHWPEPTHAPHANGRLGYRTAREIIDWSIAGESIYGRKQPLSANTMRRILTGLRKYSGLPFLTQISHTSGGPRVYSTEAPLPTLTGTREFGIFQPFLTKHYGGHDACSVDEPLPTITANFEHYGLCQPFLVVLRNNCDARSIEEPLPTLCANGEHVGLAQPFIVNLKGKSIGRQIDAPLPTNTAHAPHLYLAEPFIVEYHGDHRGRGDSGRRVRSVDEPLATIDTNNRFGLAQPYLVKYNGRGRGSLPVDEPLPTITSRDRLGLVQPEVLQGTGQVSMLDIRFRMLTPHELAAAMSFPDDYYFHGTRQAQVKQIGNAVAVRLAQSLCRSVLSN